MLRPPLIRICLLWAIATDELGFLTGFIVEMLKGDHKLDFRVDSRLPITTPILNGIIEVSGSIVPSNYSAHLFRTMCTTAFYAFLRIVEVTTTSPSPNAVLQLSQISKFADDLGACCGF